MQDVGQNGEPEASKISPLASEKIIPIVCRMTRKPTGELRRGWTTGACATAATKAALQALWGGETPKTVTIELPRGECPKFDVAHSAYGKGWAEVGIIKDAGDDPDVTHGALIISRVCMGDDGIEFRAGEGVGTVTKAGLPLAIGEAAINPKPREMMRNIVLEQCSAFNTSPNVQIEISIPNGAEIAKKTWNGRLGIIGGLSVLGTTGIVRPFSCAAWIASIHRGIDVARAEGVVHVAGCTGATSEKVVQELYGLPEFAMLDMGDFAGGMLKYLRKNPIANVTIGGGIGKMAKLAQGAVDLHSARSQVDFAHLNQWCPVDVSQANTTLEAYQLAGPELAQAIADHARQAVERQLGGAQIAIDTVVIDRAGTVLARSADE